MGIGDGTGRAAGPTVNAKNPGWYLVRVDTDYACFGFDVRNGRVAKAAPIAGWMVGRTGKAMVDYWRGRGAHVTWQHMI